MRQLSEHAVTGAEVEFEPLNEPECVFVCVFVCKDNMPIDIIERKGCRKNKKAKRTLEK